MGKIVQPGEEERAEESQDSPDILDPTRISPGRIMPPHGNVFDATRSPTPPSAPPPTPEQPLEDGDPEMFADTTRGGLKLPRATTAGTALAVAGAIAHQVIPEQEVAEKPAEVKEEESPIGDDDSAETAETFEAASTVTEVVNNTTYWHPQYTGGITRQFVDTFEEILSTESRTAAFYYDSQGKILGEIKLPERWDSKVGDQKKMTKAEKQAWHDSNRRMLAPDTCVIPANAKKLGYPFVAVPDTPKIVDKLDPGKPLVEFANDRLGETLSNPDDNYFDGNDITLRQAIAKITEAYDVPLSLALGFGANESAFHRDAISSADARGIYQLKRGAWKDAKKYAAAHPESWSDPKEYLANIDSLDLTTVLKYSGKNPEVWGDQETYQELFDDLKARQKGLGPKEKKAEAERAQTKMRVIVRANIARHVQEHPELWQGIRSGDVGNFEGNWKNRFMQAEMFCAYYKYSMEQIRPKIDELETRIRKLDPSFPSPLEDVAILTAYNAGPTRVKRCIDRFTALDDDEIKQHIGEPPYGLDVWLGVLGNAFGQEKNVALHVLTYSSKVLASGEMLMGSESEVFETNESKKTKKKKQAALARRDLFRGRFLPQAGNTAKEGGRWVATGVGTAAAVGAVMERNPETSRRSLLKTAVAGTAAVSPWAKGIGAGIIGSVSSLLKKEPEYLGYPETTTGAKESLDTLYATLKTRDVKANHGTTPREEKEYRQYGMAKYQLPALLPTFKEEFGEDFVERFRSTRKQGQKSRKPLYDEGQRAQEAYVQRELESGDLIPLEPDNPEKPYFCEQVGQWSGVDNVEPSVTGPGVAMHMRKEFEPLMHTIVELVNHQIDMFNEDPSAFNYPDFPTIPHISAIKVSGALRSFDQMHEGPSRNSAATKDVSAHAGGFAIDIGSFGNKKSHMVRFKEDFVDTDGSIIVPANGKLPAPSENLKSRTHEIISRMIGRSLLAMIDPLKENEGITLMPLLEGRQASNWHVAINPNDMD